MNWLFKKTPQRGIETLLKTLTEGIPLSEFGEKGVLCYRTRLPIEIEVLYFPKAQTTRIKVEGLLELDIHEQGTERLKEDLGESFLLVIGAITERLAKCYEKRPNWLFFSSVVGD